MFSPEQREETRRRLLSLAKRDNGVAAAAITGSEAAGTGDAWSDIDLAFGIHGELAEALGRWAEILEHDFGARHHWDLPWGSSIYRVYLLPAWLEVDMARSCGRLTKSSCAARSLPPWTRTVTSCSARTRPRRRASDRCSPSSSLSYSASTAGTGSPLCTPAGASAWMNAAATAPANTAKAAPIRKAR